MLKWILIAAITLVSTALLMFLSAYITMFDEVSQYYNVPKQRIVFLSYLFNIFYLAITPFIFPFLQKHYSPIVKISVFTISLGCIGRSLSSKNYQLSLLSSIIVGIAQVPIITAPYGLLQLFNKNEKGYASSIPLFLPTLGINYVILYGMRYVVGEDVIHLVKVREQNIEWMNKIIAIVAIVGAVVTILLLDVLKLQIQKSKQRQNGKKKGQLMKCLDIKYLQSQFPLPIPFLLLAISWGCILGLNWTYGSMFSLFLSQANLSHYDVALIGLFANVSSALFSNFGNFIVNKFKCSNWRVILGLNAVGLIGCVGVWEVGDGGWSINWVIGAVVLLRVGFSSFVSLSLIQLSSLGPSVLISSIFFYMANIFNLVSTWLTTQTSPKNSLTWMLLLILVSISTSLIVKSSKMSLVNKKGNVINNEQQQAMRIEQEQGQSKQQEQEKEQKQEKEQEKEQVEIYKQEAREEKR